LKKRKGSLDGLSGSASGLALERKNGSVSGAGCCKPKRSCALVLKSAYAIIGVYIQALDKRAGIRGQGYEIRDRGCTLGATKKLCEFLRTAL
jgi:hypothetical protein